MENQRTSLIKRATKGLAGVICAGIIATGCATSGKLFGSYGGLSGSKEITKTFTNYEAKPDHNYFMAGSDKKSPDAILALDNQYKLDNPRFWHPVDPNTLQGLVSNMQDKASESNTTPYGANVLDHNNKDIGDWYSTTNTTTIKLKDGNRVVIYAPMAGTGGRGGDSSGGSSGGGGSGAGGGM